jgi:hypothetical protein
MNHSILPQACKTFTAYKLMKILQRAAFKRPAPKARQTFSIKIHFSILGHIFMHALKI